MRVTVVQMSPGARRDDNVRQMEDVLARAIESDRPDLVTLPEMWTCLGGDRAVKFESAETLPKVGERGEPGSIHARLAALARRHGIVLHAGSIGERLGDRLCNTTLVFDRHGVELARYRKIHLFDVETERGQVYRESDTYTAGTELAVFDVGDLRIGCAICYDLRFPALFAALRDKGCEMILLPAAFTAETGAAHWDPLIRARAIETQCWVAASGTVGVHRNEAGEPRVTHGHSLICDPWGIVVAQAGRGTGWATARIDRSTTARIRTDMPVSSHRVAFE